MNAWLLTWEGTSSNISDENRLIGIIGSRRSDSFVAEIVEFIYSRNSSSASNMAYIANRPHKKYFSAETTQMINGVPHGERIICGHNPWIYARKVRNLNVSEEGDFEIVTWQEPDNYCWKDKDTREITIERPGIVMTLKRSIEHSLARELEALYA